MMSPRKPSRHAARPLLFRPLLESLETRDLPSGNLPTNLLWHTLQRADFNADGIDEVVVQARDGSWRIGPSSAQEWRFGNLSAFKGTRLVVGDFTGSGKSAVAGLGSDGLWRVGIPDNGVFKLDGWARWNYPSTWVTVLAGDVNGDGKDDVVAHNLDGTVMFALSTGTSFQTVLAGSWAPRGHWKALQLADVNGDGKQDLVGFNNDGTWWVGASTGTSLRVEAWGQWSPAGDWASIHVADFNGDGRADVAGFRHNGGWWVGLSQQTVVSTPWSVGVATAWSFGLAKWEVWSPAPSWRDVVVGDFNDDGRADVAGLSTNGTWWLARSTGQSFSTGFWGEWDMSLAYTRIVAGNFDGRSPDLGQVLGFRSDGSWVLGRPGARPEAVGVALAPFGLVSQTYDDWPDFADTTRILNPWQDDTFWQNAVAGKFGGDQRTTFFGFTRGGFAWVATPNNQVLFHSAGISGWPASMSYRKVLTGDFNGDGKMDVAAFADTGEWVVGEQVGPYRFRVRAAAFWTPATSWTDVFSGDVDGDGRDDLIGFNNDGSWWVAWARPSGFVSDQLAQWSRGSGWRFTGIGDFNDDGRTDIIGFTSGGAWWRGLSTGSGFRSEALTAWLPRSHWLHIGLTDFNGDDIPDIYGVSTDGGWWVGLNTRSGYVAGRWLRWLPEAGLKSVRQGDFNGDGRQDFLALDQAGQWWVGLAGNAAFQVRRWYTWSDTTRTDTLLLGDFTGDGATDFWAYNLQGTRNLLQGISTGGWFASGIINTDEVAPWTPGTPWATSVNRALFDNLPAALLQRLYFNNGITYERYRTRYLGVLRGWLADADALQLTPDAIPAYIRARLDALFSTVADELAVFYPRLTDKQYRLLMTMNLAHGYHIYTTVSYRGGDLVELLRLQYGDCSESAELFRSLALLQGIAADHVSWVVDYVSPSAQTQVYTIHAMIVSEGMFFDPLNNIAMKFNLSRLMSIAATDRLAYLLNNRLIYGFYNWNLKPQIRDVYIQQNNDPGILPSFYYYFLEGLGKGRTSVGIY